MKKCNQQDSPYVCQCRMKWQTKTVSTSSKLLLVLCLLVSSVIVNAQSLEWAISMGGTDNDNSRAVAVDVEGNVYITGLYGYPSADFNPGGTGGVLNNTAMPNAYIAKYDAQGKYLWAKGIESAGAGGGISLRTDEGYGVAVDSQGNVYITGNFGSATVNFNPGGSGGVLTNAGGIDIFLAKYDKDGNYLWAQSMGGVSDDYGFEVAVEPSGKSVYITGTFKQTADFNHGSGVDVLNATGTGNSFDVFLAKYDADGNYLWAKSMGGSSSDQGRGVAVDIKGNVFVTGQFTSKTADFNPSGGGGTINNAGAGIAGTRTNMFIAKYDSNGGYLWAKSVGDTDWDDGQSVAVDAMGNVYVSGGFTDTVDFNPGGTPVRLTSFTLESGDAYVAKYDTDGNCLWARGIGGMGGVGGTDYDAGNGVAVDKNGNVFITGTFIGGIAYIDTGTDTVQLIGAGKNNIFIVKYDSAGNYIWAETTGSNFAGGSGIDVDIWGSAYATGMFVNTIAFVSTTDTFTLHSTGAGSYYDPFIVKIACDTSSSFLSVTECGNSYLLNEETYTTSGTYQQRFSNAVGCDSTVTLDLTLFPIDQPVINVNGFKLGVAGQRYATYQWIKNNEAIPGATDSIYIVTENGDYQVAVSNEHGCRDTSDVYTVTNAAINAQVSADQINIYPNPTLDEVYIHSPIPVNITLTDMQGRVIKSVENPHKVSLKELADGMYLIQITDTGGLLIKVVKEIKAGSL